IPTGIQIFCWLATLWDGKPIIRTPLLFVIGFFINFVIGGLTGVMVASVPLDLQVHDTYFVVAHLHYVLIGGAVFPLFGGFYYWFPKITGRMLSERMGRWNFVLLMLGTNGTFFPMHELGLVGMPRRVYTYPAGMNWADLNLLASIGAATLALGVLLFIINVAWSLRRGERASADPWGGGTLEWGTASPPPTYNFASIPFVQSSEPLWDKPGAVVTGLSISTREVLVTSVVEARPDHRLAVPDPSIWPLLAAIAVTGLFIGSIYTAWAVPIGAIPVGIALIGWFWPKAKQWERGKTR
ncbi:MAG TPA: cbb3-type cytochrome c oxidase subunit I, partial [Xanthobacteraceae bacterium]|nr:cbb3-type cytochrome c oxidase subunit I [Xanthobacteraceae bacterium]